MAVAGCHGAHSSTQPLLVLKEALVLVLVQVQVLITWPSGNVPTEGMRATRAHSSPCTSRPTATVLLAMLEEHVSVAV
jgi:hypothetical protein